MSAVELREITVETVRTICDLEVAPDQRPFVAPNGTSIAEAHYAKHAWWRAIYAGDDPVGFVLLTIEPKKPDVWVWRFMIAAPHPGQGHGVAAMKLVIEHARKQKGAKRLKLSYVPEPGNPAPFYRKLGFAETGDVEGDEVVMQLDL